MAQVVGKKRSSDTETLPVKLEIVDVEKKKGISKYYVYVIRVTCRNGSNYKIHRRYRQFDEMQRHLEQRFPVEAGEFSQKERILPKLPGKVALIFELGFDPYSSRDYGKLYLSRSAVREVTDQRLPQLNSYLQHLFSLPNNIRYDSIVRSFFQQNPQDRQASHDHKTSKVHPAKPARPPAPSPASKKSPAPPRPAPPTRVAPPTKPPPPTLVRGPRAKALYDYTAQYEDELSFSAGAVMALEKELDSNWLQARLGRQVGLVPLTYINILEPLDSQDDIEQSDEWDSEDDLPDSSEASHITYYIGGVANSVEVGSDQVERPTFHRLRNAIQDSLGRRNFVMNYKDRVGDLIEIVDQSDLNLMLDEARHLPGHTPWTLYLTDQGDYTPYNTHPYR